MSIIPKNQGIVSDALTTDKSQALAFIEALGLDPQSLVFQKFPGKNGGYAQTQIGSLESHWEWVEVSNAGQGCSVSIMTNPANGAKKVNIALVKTVFADDDTPRKTWRNDWAIEPHVIVETSPGKYHYYWKTNPGTLAWKELGILQGKIAKTYGTDESLSDPAKKGRLPGTLHLKAEPFLTRIVEVRSHAPYSRKELVQAFGSVELESKTTPHPKSVYPQNSEQVVEGGRNTFLHRRASALRGAGLSPADIDIILSRENFEKCKPPLPENEVTAITYSASSYEPNAVRYPLTDAGNSERFAASVAGKFCYDFALKKYIYFDGRVWRPDHPGQANIAAVTVVRSILVEASQVEDEKIRLAMLAHAKKSESLKAIQALLEGAKPLLAIDSGLFDADGWKLNCTNGYLDLKSGALLPHDPAHHCFIIGGTAFYPTATAPRWSKFIEDFTCGDKQLAAYLQNLAGRCLTGDVCERTLTLMYGAGANGKSVFIKVLSEILGGYAVSLRADFFLEKGTNVDLESLELQGKRLAVCTELPSNGRLAEDRVKRLTGGDTQTGRGHWQDFCEFKATAKLLIATNHKPYIKGGTEAIWDRLRPFPCDYRASPETVNKNLADDLLRESPGILNWALIGLRDWQADGCKMPKRMESELAAYREVEDGLSAFIADHFESHPAFSVEKSVAYRLYEAWAAAEGEFKVSQKALTKQLGERGISSFRKTDSRLYQGIGLKNGCKVAA